MYQHVQYLRRDVHQCRVQLSYEVKKKKGILLRHLHRRIFFNFFFRYEVIVK